MANIYISKSFKLDYDSNRVISYLANKLERAGHVLYFSNFSSTLEIYYTESNVELYCDVFIFYVNELNVSSEEFRNEYIRFSHLNLKGKTQRLIIPIVAPDVDIRKLDVDLLNFQLIQLRDINSDTDLDELSSNVERTINKHFGRKLEQAAQQEEIKQNIESKAPIYIKDAKTRLETRASELRETAKQYFVGSYFIIIIGLFVAFWFYSTDKETLSKKPDTLVLIFFFVKSIVTLTLITAVVKYSFTLGKSYMHEALKIEDRIHAISFGEFYLNVYKEEVAPQDLKEVFRDWNINNTSTAFLSQRSEEFDPKFIEKGLDIIDKIKSATKAES